MSDPIEETTLPLAPKYRERERQITRWYRWDVSIARTFMLLSVVASVYEVTLFIRGNWWALLSILLYVWLFIIWARNIRSAKRRRLERTIELTKDIAFDASIRQLIEHEEDHQ